MARRSLLSKIFGSNDNNKIPSSATEFTVLNGEKAVFTKYNGRHPQ